MSSSLEYINIKKCPICGGSHKYELEIRRSFVFSYEIPRAQGRKKRFIRLFHCPNKNQDFQVTFYLTEYPSSEIESVKVGKSNEK